MITLYVAGPLFPGLPDPSPFVSKAEILLKMSGLSYQTCRANFSKAPKGKIPYIADAGQTLGDTTFIRWHLEQTHGIDFDPGLTDAEKAVAWAFEKMREEHLYWAMVQPRWWSGRISTRVRASSSRACRRPCGRSFWPWSAGR